METAAALAGLFVSALLAASPIPLQSEVVFVALQLAHTADVWLLVLVAGVGNTVGSFITYALGRGASRWRNRRWFPASAAQMARAERWFARWGVWVLLLSWAPGGDLVTLVAGVLRTPPWLFGLLVATAKFSRYAALAWLTAQAMGYSG
ncbi:MAG: DedA family protein [Rhodobacteraceae bacterium]|nr:DedA family protein [Paracoccaceae bacterium]